MEIKEDLEMVRYIGGESAGDDGQELTPGKVYEVIGSGTAEHKETGEEFGAIAIQVPEMGLGHWAIVDAADEDGGNAKYFETVE